LGFVSLMRVLLIITSIFLFSCKFFEEEKKADFKPIVVTYYISNLRGYPLFANRNSNEEVVRLPYKSKVNVTQITERDEWRKVDVYYKTGWLKYDSSFLSSLPMPTKYYSVVAKS
jgi:hypothetical protein